MLWRGGAGPARRAGRLCVLAAPRWERAATAGGAAGGSGAGALFGESRSEALCDERGERREGGRDEADWRCFRAAGARAVIVFGAGSANTTWAGRPPSCGDAILRSPNPRPVPVLPAGAVRGFVRRSLRCVSRVGHCTTRETFLVRLVVEQSARRSLLVSLFFSLLPPG